MVGIWLAIGLASQSIFPSSLSTSHSSQRSLLAQWGWSCCAALFTGPLRTVGIFSDTVILNNSVRSSRTAARPSMSRALKKSMVVKWPKNSSCSPATVPFGHKVGNDRSPKQAICQHCQTGPTIFMYIAQPCIVYTYGDWDFFPNDNILQSTYFETSEVNECENTCS